MGNKIQRIYVGENLVRPPNPYTPTSNTIAYFPFRNDQLDTQNNYTIPATGTKQQIGYKFTATTSGIIFNTSISTKERFVGFWVKPYSLSKNFAAILIRNGGLRVEWNMDYSQHGERKVFTMKNSGGTFYNSGVISGSWNNWNYVAYSIDTSNNIKCYVNGSQVWSLTQTPSTYTDSYLMTGRADSEGEMIFLDLIIDSSSRTATEISNYYNKTKSLYGL